MQVSFSSHLFSGLILVKMLSEYIDMSNLLPALSSEVVLRVVEILKHFNTRTCQLVLGAHAMQVCAPLGVLVQVLLVYL